MNVWSAVWAVRRKRTAGDRHPDATDAARTAAEAIHVTTAVPAVEAKNLFKVFGRNPQQAVRRLKAGETREQVSDVGTAAVIDAGFTVQPGEIFVIMGLSGSGKSTIIRMLNGLLQPTAGEVLVQGANVTTARAGELRAIRRRSMSMVFQHFALLPHLTVLDNAAYALEIQGVGKTER